MTCLDLPQPLNVGPQHGSLAAHTLEADFATASVGRLAFDQLIEVVLGGIGSQFRGQWVGRDANAAQIDMKCAGDARDVAGALGGGWGQQGEGVMRALPFRMPLRQIASLNTRVDARKVRPRSNAHPH